MKVLRNENTESLLAGKRLFVTGGTGMIGKWLLTELLKFNVEVVVLSRDPSESIRKNPHILASSNLSFIKGDVRDFNFPKRRFDYIIHAATPVVSDELGDTELANIILDGTKRVLDFATRCKCERLLYVSSGAVYGAQPPELDRIPETFPCNPTSAYGNGKLMAENLCLNSEVPSVIARCFAFVGPGFPLNAHFAIGNFMGSCLRGEPILIKGDGTPLRSYMYSSDLAEWLIMLLMKGRIGECYNVGSEESISIRELAELVCRLTKRQSGLDYTVSAQNKELPRRYIPSTSKARHELGLVCRVGLQEAILLSL